MPVLTYSATKTRSFNDGTRPPVGYDGPPIAINAWASDTGLGQGRYVTEEYGYEGSSDVVWVTCYDGPFYGTMHFGAGPAALAGKVIDSARIRLYRYSDSPGGSGAVPVVMYQSALTDVPGAGAGTHGSVSGGGTTICSLTKGQGGWYTLPVALAQALIAGKCLVIYSGNSNLSRMYGIESASYKPQIEITYHDPVPMPSPPVLDAIAPITADSKTFGWKMSSDASGYFTAAQLSYELEISTDNGATWGTTHAIAANTLTHVENLRTYLSLVAAQYYYNQTVKIHVRSVTPAWTDTNVYRSAWAESPAFTIDYRIAPTAPASLSVDNPTPFEGQSVVFTIGRPSAGGYNGKDSAGANEGIHYYVQLADGTALKDVDTDVSFATKPTAAYVVGDLTTGLVDRVTTIKANAITHKASDGALEQQISPFIADVAFTIKRFRVPVLIITGVVNRTATQATIKVRVTDTGYGGTQAGTQIQKFQVSLGGAYGDITPGAWGGAGLDNEFTINGLDANTSYALSIKAVNNPPSGIAGKESEVYTFVSGIPTYMPALAALHDDSATLNQAPLLGYTPGFIVGDDPDAALNKGCAKVQNDLDVGGALRKGGKDVLTDAALKAVNRQDNTTNNAVSNQLVKTGWGFVAGGGTNSYVQKVVTFDAVFDDVPVVVCTVAGSKATSGGAPSSLSDLTGGTLSAFGHVNAIQASQFTMNIINRDNTALLSTVNYGYTWIAIGTKAR